MIKERLPEAQGDMRLFGLDQISEGNDIEMQETPLKDKRYLNEEGLSHFKLSHCDVVMI